MSFPFHIAKRYIFSKKSHHSINIISSISVLGVTIATTAMVCILSVFNGFESMVAGLFTSFDPQLKVVPTSGKYFKTDTPVLSVIGNHHDVDMVTEVVEDKALAASEGRQMMVTVKGVDDSFERQSDIDKILVGEGVFDLHAVDLQYGVFGVNVLTSLGLNIDFDTPVKIYAPKKGEKINLSNPMNDFRQDELYSPHVAFMVMQAKYDSHYVISSLSFARRIFDKQGMATSLEVKLKEGADVDDVKKDLKSSLGAQFDVLDRYEQQADTFKIMKVEKFVSYAFLTFILLIASFNVISSLSMLIIDKRDDIRTLHNLGASNKDISWIFMIEGWMISISGVLIGIVLGVALCLIQQEFGVLKFGSSAGSYIVDTYPVRLLVSDIVLVFFTVVVIGLLSVWFPVRHFSKQQIKRAEN